MIPPPKPLLEWDLCPLDVGYKITGINHSSWSCEQRKHSIGPPYPLPRIFNFSFLDDIAVVYSLDMEPWCNYGFVLGLWRTPSWHCDLGANVKERLKNQIFTTWGGLGAWFAGVDLSSLCKVFRVPLEAFPLCIDSLFKDSKYPSICQACNSPAYISNQFIECSNSACKWASK